LILNMRDHPTLPRAPLAVAFLLAAAAASAAEPCLEDFANVDALAAAGWSIANLSDPVGAASWHQGDAEVFPSYEGAPDAYAAVGMDAAKGWPSIVDVWLVTPLIDFGPNSINAHALDIYTRALPGAANRLVVRQCLVSDAETCAIPASGVGGFATALIEINPDLALDGFPDGWTHYVVTPADGLATLGRGRIAFQYSIPVQPDGSHGTYVGLDSVVMTGATSCPFGQIVFENGFDPGIEIGSKD
jgi:hypothetical protein